LQINDISSSDIVSRLIMAIVLGNIFLNKVSLADARCHDANGEVYYVTFSREQVRITSYSDDDTVPALA
jgi:hypothetical protein